jgi:secondary thiamine-phosphate synthase enzyme
MGGMTQTLTFETGSSLEFIDITKKVRDIVKKSKTRHGIATVYTKHTTTAIRINENEKLLLSDLRNFLDSIAPRLKLYNHDDIDKRQNTPEDEPCNAHSHLKSLLLGTSESIPISNGSLQLGKWQSILFIELDGPRKREVIVQVLGR